MGCWVRRFTTTNTSHHQQLLVKRNALANKPCMTGEHHGPNKCVQHHPPPTFISLLSHVLQRKKHGYPITVGRCVRRGWGESVIIYFFFSISLMLSFHAILRWRLLHVFCVPALLVSTRKKCVQQHHPPTTFIYPGMFTVSCSCSLSVQQSSAIIYSHQVRT